jgi:hypothetical protein
MGFIFQGLVGSSRVGREPGHLPLIVFALGLPAHHQHALALAVQVGIQRRLVAGRVPDFMLLPGAGLVLRVLVPVARRTGEADDDLVHPAIAVEVVGEDGERLAIALGRVVLADLADRLELLEVRAGVPAVADQQVHLAVPVDIGHRDALRAEGAVHCDLLPA